MQQIELFDFRRDILFLKEIIKSLVFMMSLAKLKTKEEIEHIDPKKKFYMWYGL